jgi:hypothetical protein
MVLQLSFERELPQQLFYALEPLVAFNREMERLAGEGVVPCVQEGDHGSRLDSSDAVSGSASCLSAAGA